ncbi:MAG TPA: UV damage endonuclease UvsE, partial [Desulfobacteria bacterium]|nr:UV damage endonuclease UvsE [Desulfobacteria bacterium]
PMVLDVHHHQCLNRGENIDVLIEKVFDTWHQKIPKIHFSSPKSEENCRAHADDIDPHDFYEFLLKAKEVDKDFDVMIEAKNKDVTLFNLMKSLRKQKGVNVIDEAELII